LKKHGVNWCLEFDFFLVLDVWSLELFSIQPH